MIRRPPRSTRTDTLFPYPTLFRSTRLPPGVVRRLVGTLAHPLNKARFDPASGQVERGYTIIQPRVELAPDTTGQSLFSRFYGGDTAIDIYSRAVSDVYQALLGDRKRTRLNSSY